MCEICGDEIAAGRLEARPWTPYCIRHASGRAGWAGAPTGLAATWWDRIVAGFTQSPLPQVTATELAVVVLLAVAVSLPRATWRYFGLLATVTHELGHAFAALMTGQRLGGIRLSLNHSGTTTTYSRGRLPAVWSTFWGYPVPAVVGAAMVWSGFNGWGPAAMSVGTIVLLASFLFLRNGIGLLITAAAVLAAVLLVLFVPPEFNGHVMIVLGLALLVAAVRDLGKLLTVHLRRRDRCRRRTPTCCTAQRGCPPRSGSCFSPPWWRPRGGSPGSRWRRSSRPPVLVRSRHRLGQ